MHLLLLLAALSSAEEPEAPSRGHIVVDARVPAEVLFDGQMVGQLYFPSTLRVEVPAGEHTLRIYTNGVHEDLAIDVPSDDELQVLVGRTGTTVEGQELSLPSEQEEVTEVAVQFRVHGTEPVRMVLGKRRFDLATDEQVDVTLKPGSHKLSLRNEDGTVIWASGMLRLTGPEDVVVQITEGRMPEVGGGGEFSSGR